MTKDNAKTLADRYFRDQCRRMGIPVLDDARPAAKKRTHAFGKRVTRDANGYVIVDPKLVEKDTQEGLAAERKEVWVTPRTHAGMIANLGDLTAPKMGLDEIWQAGHEMFSRDDVWAAFRDPPDDKKQ